MKAVNLVRSLALGAFVGCFVISIIEILMALVAGPENFVITGSEIINLVLGSIVIGFAFSLPTFIYERDDIALPFQVIFQMGIGMIVLFVVAIYFGWMPITSGLAPILIWVGVAFAFSVIFWLGFYLYYFFAAKKLNEKIKSFE